MLMERYIIEFGDKIDSIKVDIECVEVEII
jgi:hypothetical protein